jgi:hypothetical protein
LEVSGDELTSGQGDGGVYVSPKDDKTGSSGAWVRQFKGFVTPEMYGALGDGSTDDGDSFVKAAESGHKVQGVYGKVYAMENQSISTQCTIEMYQSALKLMDGASGTDGWILRFDDGADGSLYQGGKIDGNKSNVDESTGNGKLSGINIETCQCTVRDVVILESSRHGIVVTSSSDATVEDIVGKDNATDTVSFEGAVRSVAQNIRGFRSESRGTLEFNDGCENCTARDIYGEDQWYAVDIQDHHRDGDHNKNLVIDGVVIKGCDFGVHSNTSEISEAHYNISILSVSTKDGVQNSGTLVHLKWCESLSVSGVHWVGQTDGKCIHIIDSEKISINSVTINNGNTGFIGILLQHLNSSNDVAGFIIAGVIHNNSNADWSIKATENSGGSLSQMSIHDNRAASDIDVSGLQSSTVNVHDNLTS